LFTPAPKTEGLFRVAGPKRAIDALRARVEAAPNAPDAATLLERLLRREGSGGGGGEEPDVATVASLLKLWLRELPTPLLPPPLLARLLALRRAAPPPAQPKIAPELGQGQGQQQQQQQQRQQHKEQEGEAQQQQHKEEESVVETLQQQQQPRNNDTETSPLLDAAHAAYFELYRRVLDELPARRLALLRYLCLFLARVAAHSGEGAGLHRGRVTWRRGRSAAWGTGGCVYAYVYGGKL